MPYILERDIRWEMAHSLVDYVGPCSRIHGHSWVATVKLRFRELDKAGMGVDFTDMKVIDRWIDDNWDHRCLLHLNHTALQPYIDGPEQWDPIINELGFVPVEYNPTSENLAKRLALIVSELMGIDLEDVRVSVRETSKNCCTYVPQESW